MEWATVSPGGARVGHSTFWGACLCARAFYTGSGYGTPIYRGSDLFIPSDVWGV